MLYSNVLQTWKDKFLQRELQCYNYDCVCIHKMPKRKRKFKFNIYVLADNDVPIPMSA